MYADHQRYRIGVSNQIASLTVDPSGYTPYRDTLVALERDLSRALVSLYRSTVPAGVLEWQAQTLGVGEHLLARLLGHLGHPRLATPKHWAQNSTIRDGEWGDAENPKRMLIDGQPFLRSCSQLLQYCGHGAAGRRVAGMSQAEAFALGRPECKMLVNRIADSIVKAQVRTRPTGEKYALGELGQLYLDTKARYAERTHSGPCPGGVAVVNGRALRIRCKIDGRYADTGDPFQPSHLQAIGLRHLGKQILRELFDASQEEWCPLRGSSISAPALQVLPAATTTLPRPIAPASSTKAAAGVILPSAKNEARPSWLPRSATNLRRPSGMRGTMHSTSQHRESVA
jgi:hypothetical protein